MSVVSVLVNIAHSIFLSSARIPVMMIDHIFTSILMVLVLVWTTIVSFPCLSLLVLIWRVSVVHCASIAVNATPLLRYVALRILPLFAIDISPVALSIVIPAGRFNLLTTIFSF